MVSTSRVVANEVVKAEDFDFAFKSFTENFLLGMRLVLGGGANFIIGGDVSPYSAEEGESMMNVVVSPVLSCCREESVNTERCAMNGSLSGPVTLETGGDSDRRDTLEIWGEYETYDEQQRAFNDPATDIITYQDTPTKQRVALRARAKKGTGLTAPAATKGCVKIAEVLVPAGAVDISQCTVFPVTADAGNPDGTENSGWTNERQATVRILPAFDLYTRFREVHNSDGSLKSGIVGASNLDPSSVTGAALKKGGESVEMEDGQAILSGGTVSAAISALAGMVNALWASYKRHGDFSFLGRLSLSSKEDGDGGLSVPLEIKADGDGSAVFSVGGKPVCTLSSDGKLVMDAAYTPSEAADVVTYRQYGDLIRKLADLDDRIEEVNSYTIESQSYVNGLLARYPAVTVVKAATTGSVTTVNLSAVDGMEGSSFGTGDLVLVKDQADKRDNGLYSVNADAEWTRKGAGETAGTLFVCKNGAVNGGRIFYCLQDAIVTGETELTFAEAPLSLEASAWKIVLRDEQGGIRVKNMAAKDVTCSGTMHGTTVKADGEMSAANFTASGDVQGATVRATDVIVIPTAAPAEAEGDIADGSLWIS